MDSPRRQMGRGPQAGWTPLSTSCAADERARNDEADAGHVEVPGGRVDPPQLRGGLRRAPEATASWRAAGGCALGCAGAVGAFRWSREADGARSSIRVDGPFPPAQVLVDEKLGWELIELGPLASSRHQIEELAQERHARAVDRGDGEDGRERRLAEASLPVAKVAHLNFGGRPEARWWGHRAPPSC